VAVSEARRPRSARRAVAALGAAVLLLLIVLSPTFGRADPTGSYRPELPPDALTNGCWPLPGGVRLDFGYQIRSDELLATTTGGKRRLLVLHYDEVSGEEAIDSVESGFATAGVADVQVIADDFVGTAPDAVVRGQMVLDLPPSRPEGRPECRAPFSTKKFTPEMGDRS
jgi:hypothetical protein